MRCIYNSSTDPYFNLAAEEYLANNYKSDVFMLWRNSPAVIIGKNQNGLAEVDLEYAKRENIPVIRRITGGGAVFHDLGNVNYTFITKSEGGIDFERFASPIVSALEKMGLSACLGGRNDILAEGFKISGNAQCRVNTEHGFVTLHHGTLLLGAELSRLSAVLKPNKLKLESKGIKSISSRVKNISAFKTYRGPSEPEDFIKKLFELCGGAPEGLTAEEISEITELVDTKYRTWEWNFGENPSFETVREGRYPFGTVTSYINCRKGRIEKIKFSGDFFEEDVERLEEHLVGTPFDKESLSARLEGGERGVGEYIFGATAAELCSLIFPEE